MKRKKIVVLGSNNTDMVIKSDRLPVPGETVMGGEFMITPGGKGANQAVAAARLGGDVTFIAKTGNDLFGRQSIEQFQDEGVNTDFIISDPVNPSGIALISVDSLGENSIVVAPGANKTFHSQDLKKAENTIASADILLMQLEIPIATVEYAAKIAKANKVKVILNPAPAQQLSDEFLSNISVLIPNRTEAEMLSGIKVSDWESARNAADIISNKGVDIVIITLSSEGALLKEKGIYYEIASPKVQTVDTTAAGDTFCGALAVALSEEMPLEKAVEFANKCASISVTRMGARISIPHRREIGE